MSKKRTTAESNNDDLTNDGTGSSAKRARPDPPNDTTTPQDLPIELLQRILVRAIVSEVEDLKLSKCVWKEKADLVIERLRAVSSQWNNLISTNYFRNELHRTLDGTAQKSIRLEVLRQSWVQSNVRTMTVLGDEIFAVGILSSQQHGIVVYNRRDTTEVRSVISLGLSAGDGGPRNCPCCGPYPYRIAGCNVANCVYLVKTNSSGITLKRIAKAEGHPLQFNVSPWLTDHRRSIDCVSVSDNGSLLVLSEARRHDPNVVSVYDADGALLREVMFTTDEEMHGVVNVLQKSDGNLVVACIKREHCSMNLLEIDGSGLVERQYETTLGSDKSLVNFADSCGRIAIIKVDSGIELLDSEFNLLGVHDLPQEEGSELFIYGFQYDSVRNEIVLFKRDINYGVPTKHGFTFLRFTEE